MEFAKHMENRGVVSAWHKVFIAFFYVCVVWLCFNVFIPRDQVIYTYDLKRFFSLFVVFLLSFGVILFPSIRAQIFSHSTSIPPVIRVLVLIFCSSIFVFDLFNSQYFYYSYIYDFYLVGVSGCVFLFLKEYQEKKTTYFFMACLITVCLFSSVALAFIIRISSNLYVDYHTILSFVNPRFMNQIQAWIIVPVLYLSVREQLRQKSAIFYNIVLSLNFSLIVTLDARGLSIAVVGGLVLISFLDKSHRLVWIKTAIINFLFGLIISVFFFKFIPSQFLGGGPILPEIRTGSSGRVDLWMSTLSSSSLWGHGGGSFVCGGFKFGHPHNSVLTIIYEWGVIAALSYMALCAMLLRYVWFTQSRLILVAGVNLMTGTAYSLVSGVFIMPLSQLMAVLSLALFWSVTKPSNKTTHQIRTWHHMLILFIASGVLMSSLYLVYQRLPFYEGMDQLEVLQNGKVGVNMWVGGNCFR